MPDRAKEFDVLAAGELYTDVILSGFDSWPQPGHEAIAKAFHREVGGGAAITACGLAKLGSSTAVLGVVGKDGDWLLEQLEHNGVDASRIGRHPTEPTALTVAVSTPGERTFLTYRGANASFPATLAEAAAEKRLQARHVHLAFPPDLSTAPELFANIHAAGCTLSLDVGWNEDWLRDGRISKFLPLLDLFFPSEMEAHCITCEKEPEKMLQWFAATGLARVALKLGARGAALLWDGKFWFDAPLPVEPIDTTGSGDCFDAGFLHCWLKGESPEKCLRAANICGALSTEAYGGVAAFPDTARLSELLKAHS